MAAQANIPVEFFYDEESGHWGFVVAVPSVVGGGDATLDGARRHAAEAVAFALESRTRRVEPISPTGRVEYLPVLVSPGEGRGAGQ